GGAVGAVLHIWRRHCNGVHVPAGLRICVDAGPQGLGVGLRRGGVRRRCGRIRHGGDGGGEPRQRKPRPHDRVLPEGGCGSGAAHVYRPRKMLLVSGRGWVFDDIFTPAGESRPR
ncbi:unnamed protein product, partial [Laminaria digitata]